MYEHHVPITPGNNPNEGRVTINGQFEYLYDNLSGYSLNTFVTGGTVSGDVLTLARNDGTTITIPLSAATSEAVLYTNSAATQVTIGGVEIGSSFSAVTMQDMWSDLLYPELTPRFASFSIPAANASVDVGYTFTSGTHTFTWSTTNDSFIKPTTVKIIDYSSLTWLATGLDNDGTEDINIGYDIQQTGRTSNRFIIYSQKINNTWFGRNYYWNWYWRRFYGGSTNPSLNASGITGLTNNELSRLITGPFEFSAGTGSYKYIALPESAGWVDPAVTNPYGYWSAKDPEVIIDALTNLNIALADSSDGYTDTINGLPYKEMIITNLYGYSETYRVFRSKFKLGGAINIIIQ